MGSIQLFWVYVIVMLWSLSKIPFFLLLKIFYDSWAFWYFMIIKLISLQTKVVAPEAILIYFYYPQRLSTPSYLSIARAFKISTSQLSYFFLDCSSWPRLIIKDRSSKSILALTFEMHFWDQIVEVMTFCILNRRPILSVFKLLLWIFHQLISDAYHKSY